MIAKALRTPTPTLIHMAASRYHGLPQLSRGQMCDFLDSRWGYFKRHVEKDPLYQVNQTAEMEFGTWFHELIFEHRGDLNNSGLCEIPSEVLSNAGHKRGKKYDEWEAQHAHERIVTASEKREIAEMLAAIQRHPIANGLLLLHHDNAENEVSILWHEEATGCGLRARLDRVIPGLGIVDLKTINKADPWSVRREIRDRKYHVQGGVYQQGHYRATGQQLPFVLVFSEKSFPWRCVVRQIPQKGLDIGWSLAVQAQQEIQECRESGDWRDVENKSEEAVLADDPMWEET